MYDPPIRPKTLVWITPKTIRGGKASVSVCGAAPLVVDLRGPDARLEFLYTVPVVCASPMFKVTVVSPPTLSFGGGVSVDGIETMPR